MYLKYSSNFASNDTYEEFRDGRGTGKGLADFEFCFYEGTHAEGISKRAEQRGEDF